MKSYDKLKANMKAIQKQMIEATKNKCTNALKEVKRLCKHFGFNAEIFTRSIAEGREKL